MGKKSGSKKYWMEEKQFLPTLDPIVFVGDDTVLYYIGFNKGGEKDRAFFGKEGKRFLSGAKQPIKEAQRQVEEYILGERKNFQLPLHIIGTDFQNKVWQALCTIPYGQVWSYKNLAEAVQSPKAYRAAGSANGANRFSIVIPCHRVIAHNQTIGGYGGGIENKKVLLALEQRYKEE